MQKVNANLGILSLNAQRINSKYDDLEMFLVIARQKNAYFNAMFLQQTWLSDQSYLSFYQIDGFHCCSQGKRCSPYCGFNIYRNSQPVIVIDIENDSAVWD